jgi:hypothetical protein
MINLSLSNSGNYCAYVIQPQGSAFQGVLFVYDLKKRQSVKCVPVTFSTRFLTEKKKKWQWGITRQLPRE